jgi:hypothetical protein
MIRPERLQLGDIVRYTRESEKSVLCKINELFIGSLWKDAISLRAESFDGKDYFYGHACDFTPEPITNDFLRANGFLREDALLFDEAVGDTDWWVKVYPCDGPPIRIGYDLKNCHFRAGNCANDNCWMSVGVHSIDEFQRCLRFCLRYDKNFEVAAE